MEGRQRQYQISRPKPIADDPPVPPKLIVPVATPTAEKPPSNQQGNGPRPLSDIRELSEPSVIDSVFARSIQKSHPRREVGHLDPLPDAESPLLQKSIDNTRHLPATHEHLPGPSAENPSSSYSSSPEPLSFYNIPTSSIPRRSSSQGRTQRPPANHARKPSVRVVEPHTAQPDSNVFTVPNRGQSRSPVKEQGLRLDPVKSDTSRRLPSKTYIRSRVPIEILELPSYRHPRVRLELQVSAPLFVGGGSVEGQVKVTVDDNAQLRHRRSLGILSISIDLLGFEDMAGGRKTPFLSLGTDLFDADNPPPANMIEPANPLTPRDRFWTLKPSSTVLPFMLSLPLHTGRPTFSSKSASIRFLLCATAEIRDAGKPTTLRTSRDINVLPTYDPEKALASLSTPAVVVDRLALPRFGRCESLKLTAGMHRQVWVSGGSVFVDVHISNRTHRPVKRMELVLERYVLCYKHTTASSSQRGIRDSEEKTPIARLSTKPGDSSDWKGVEPYQSETRTWELQIPRGHATVVCGEHFEVRFVLTITASLSSSKTVSVALIVILIHINSLDVLPNSVEQVAAAIEEKRQHQRSRSRQHRRAHSRSRSANSPLEKSDLRRKQSYTQGRAFAAPRQQSTERRRGQDADMDDLRHALDASPRKYHRPPDAAVQGLVIRKKGSNLSVSDLNKTNNRRNPSDPLAEMTYRTPPRLRPKISRPYLVDGGGKIQAAKLHQMPSFDDDCGLHNRSVTAPPPLPVKRVRPLGREVAEDPQKKTQDQNVKPVVHSTTNDPLESQNRRNPFHLLDPHTLGLPTTTTSSEQHHRRDPPEDAPSSSAANDAHLLGTAIPPIPLSILSRHGQRYQGTAQVDGGAGQGFLADVDQHRYRYRVNEPDREVERAGTSLSFRSKTSRELRRVVGVGGGGGGPSASTSAGATAGGAGGAGATSFEVPGLNRSVRRKGTSGSLKEKGRAWFSEKVVGAWRGNRGEIPDVRRRDRGREDEDEEEEVAGWI